MKVLEQRQHELMMNAPVSKLVIRLAIPTVITMLITVIYNTADTYFVSQINKSASAGVGAVYSLMGIIQAVGYGLGMGAGSLCSRKLGEEDSLSASVFSSSAFFCSIFLGLIITGAGLIFLQPFMRFLGCSETMMPYAVPYARFILIGAPISCATFVLNNVLRSEGNAKLAMIGTVTGGIINIALDPIFIFTLGMQTGGAALATMISQTVTFLMLLSAFLLKKTIINLSVKNISKKIKTYGLILATGFPTIIRQGLGSVAAAVLNIQAVAFGDAAVAAITISGKIYVFVRNFVIGIGQGFQPVAGYNYGAKNYARTKKAFSFATTLGTLVCIVFAGIVFILREKIMWWFCADVEVMEIGTKAILFGAMVMPLMAFSTFTNQLYQGLGFKVGATFLASLRQGIFFIPIMLFLPSLIGLSGICLAQPLSDLLTAIISVPFLIVFIKKRLKEK